jgi:hypothetical protein
MRGLDLAFHARLMELALQAVNTDTLRGSCMASAIVWYMAPAGFIARKKNLREHTGFPEVCCYGSRGVEEGTSGTRRAPGVLGGPGSA